MSGLLIKRVAGAWRVNLARILWLLLLVSPAVTASTTDQDMSLMLGERPSRNGEPTVIEVGLFVIDVDEVDDVNQRFSVDMFISARWKDHRLALPPPERKGQKRFMSLDDIWVPRILFINDRGLTAKLREGAEVDDKGNVRFQNRLSGELAANLEFEEFPFDVQRLPINIVSYAYTADDLQFSPSSVIISQAEKFSIEGWTMKLLEPDAGSFTVPMSGEVIPRLTYIIEARRDSDYYVLTMLIPMSLIIFMAWTVFWLQPDIVPPRIAISTASIFSLIALGVSIRLGLPKVSYLTRADFFVLGCTLMVFIALAVAVLGSRWANSDRMEQALKANTIARWVYMLMFFFIAIAAIYY
jgi:hypothetical protein